MGCIPSFTISYFSNSNAIQCNLWYIFYYQCLSIANCYRNSIETFYMGHSVFVSSLLTSLLIDDTIFVLLSNGWISFFMECKQIAIDRYWVVGFAGYQTQLHNYYVKLDWIIGQNESLYKKFHNDQFIIHFRFPAHAI